jgi:hypothetical protein
MLGVAQGHQPANFLGAFKKRDGIRQNGRLRVLAVRMIVTQGRVGGDAIAEEVSGRGDKGFNRHGRFLAAGLAQDWTAIGVLARVSVLP